MNFASETVDLSMATLKDLSVININPALVNFIDMLLKTFFIDFCAVKIESAAINCSSKIGKSTFIEKILGMF